MKYPDGRVPLLSGGPLKSKYSFEQLHFHWGLKNNEGSEHTIDGRYSSMEMHALFRNTKYDQISDATNYRNGLAVLGFLFEVRWTGKLTAICKKIIIILGFLVRWLCCVGVRGWPDQLSEEPGPVAGGGLLHYDTGHVLWLPDEGHCQVAAAGVYRVPGQFDNATVQWGGQLVGG